MEKCRVWNVKSLRKQLFTSYFQMTRNILEEPRVTRFKIDWGGDNAEAPNEMETEMAVEMRDNTESSLMEPPLKSYIHSESSHSTMEVV